VNRWRVLVPAVLMLGVLAGCGDTGYQGPKVATMLTGGKPAETAQLSDEDRDRAFENCMKDKGVTMEFGPDSQPPSEEMMQKMNEAAEACRHLMPNAGAPPPVDAKQLDEGRKQAQCMREHGVDAHDPTSDNPWPTYDNFNPDSEQGRKAMEDCMGVPKAEPTQ
jgi:hypothetical protein